MSTGSEEMERRKIFRPKTRRCSDGVAIFTKSATHGILKAIHEFYNAKREERNWGSDGTGTMFSSSGRALNIGFKLFLRA